MNKKVISSREIQRNYRELIDRVKETSQVVYLGARSKPEAVLLGVDTFERLNGQISAKKPGREELKIKLDQIAKSGKQNVSLSQFVLQDRHRH
jgi:prevent-host-death family protein